MKTHVAKCSMLIRVPVDKVFRAFVDPETITQFWLESTTGPLAEGARVTWRFLVPGATDTVTVTAFEDRKRIGFDWSDGISVDMRFEAAGEKLTKLAVAATGFRGEGAEASAIGATEGFAIVLCDLKTLLEGGRSAGLVRDKARLIEADAGRGGGDGS
jgi:uncharacterized protein YndB with AHSA1/START domain